MLRHAHCMHKEKYIQQTNLEHDKFVTNMEEEEVPHWMSEKGVLCHQWQIVLIAMKMDDQGAASQRISLIGRQHPTHQNYHRRGNHQKIWRQNPKLMITIRLCKMFVARGERSSILTFETSSSIWGLNVSDDTMVTWNNDNDNDDFIEMANGIKSNGWWKYVIKEHTYWHNREQFLLSKRLRFVCWRLFIFDRMWMESGNVLNNRTTTQLKPGSTSVNLHIRSRCPHSLWWSMQSSTTSTI